MGHSFSSAVLSTAEVNARLQDFPVDVEVVPGKLSVRVFHHEIETVEGGVPCWTFVSSGLHTFVKASFSQTVHEQQEVCFTLRVAPDVDPGHFPTAPLRMMAFLLDYVNGGRPILAGSSGGFGPPDFMGAVAVTYALAHPLSGVEMPPRALAAVLLNAEEREVLEGFGPTRVLAALARKYRMFPYAPWWDPDRPSVLSMERTRGSLLSSVPSMAVSATVRMEQRRVVLRVRPDMLGLLREGLEPLPLLAPCALRTELDPDADGCLAWEAGQTEPMAITPPGSRAERVAGAFIAFAPEDEDGNAGVSMYEDGFVVLLKIEAIEAFRSALCAGDPIALSADGSRMEFALEWGPMAERYYFDRFTVTRRDGWETMERKDRSEEDPSAPVRMVGMLLLQPGVDTLRSVRSEDLAGYLDQLTELVSTLLAPGADGAAWDLRVDIALASGAPPELELAFKGDARLTDAAVDELGARLRALETPEARTRRVAFQVLFAIGRGSGQPHLPKPVSQN
jgi:hypothetical protein